ncbi:MAG: NADP-dependent phosphogluconate dehydrogenase, partial [Actinobacteria bacterium]|nr:NADP-dependent phosphogluconate dehydrogenase [Actinomycetota bacterium]
MSGESRFGLTGLAVMGANLARNVAHHGVPIAVHNRTPSKTEQFMAEHGDEGQITGAASIPEFVAALAQPRVVMTMVKAGGPVDAVIEELAPHLSPGDIVIDGGNSHYRDTQRRTADLDRRGLRFLGIGVSGGEEGALLGPSIMAGGNPAAYAEVEPILRAIAAQVDGTPCCAHIGTDGAGHYVKMVHNGIEYADIQLIAEAFDLLRHGAGLEVPEIAGVFADWNEGELDSFLIEITAKVLGKTDESTGRPLVDVIVDEAAQKGTGRWTAQDALELGIPLTAITEAVFARSLSALRDQRATASERLAGPSPGDGPGGDRSLIDDIRQALYASKIVAYAQGFQQMTAAAAAEGWDIDMGETATIW